MYKRTETRPIKVGNVQIGGQNKVSIQSMTNTKTKDVASTVKQILELEKAGCEIIRVACLDMEDAKAIKGIKEQIHIPIVADIHFDYKIAICAIEAGVDKVRINPGNIGGKEKVKAVVDKCKEYNVPIRIGVNAGSLEKDLLAKYGGKPTAKAMVESAKRHVKTNNFRRMMYPLGTQADELQNKLFETQENIIKFLVERESCIIVGRCSDFILADEPHILRIYIYAPYEVRIKNCVEELHLEESEAKKMIKEVDQARDNYHMHYTGYLPNDQRFKEIMIDSSLFGTEGTADYLVEAVKRYFELG